MSTIPLTRPTSRSFLQRARQVMMNRDLYTGLLFISPWLIGFLAFVVYPIVSSLYYSFTRFNIIQPAKFIGLGNYVKMFSRDEFMPRVLYNTVYFVALGVPAGTITAFLLANLLNQNIRFRSFFRAIFYLPSIVPATASAMVWLWIYNSQYGVINSVLRGVGLQAIPFLSSTTLSKPSLILINCWASGSTMLIFLAALQDVPRSLYDAASVDGASRLQRFWHVTVPMCTPAMLFVLLTGLIGAFQYFTFAWILTQGGPNFSTEFYAVYLYRNAFEYFNMGYASALAWFLFLIVVSATIAVFRSSGRWVHYGGA